MIREGKSPETRTGDHGPRRRDDMAGDRTGARVFAEFLGTAILVATVVGSGIMGTDLSKDAAVALIANALATVAVLGTLIWLLGPVSGDRKSTRLNSSH